MQWYSKKFKPKKSGGWTRHHTLGIAACLGSASGMLLVAQPSLAGPTSSFSLFSENLYPTSYNNSSQTFGNGNPNFGVNIGATVQYKVNGITLTVSNPKAGNVDKVSLFASNAQQATSGALRGQSALGTCLGGSR